MRKEDAFPVEHLRTEIVKAAGEMILTISNAEKREFFNRNINEDEVKPIIHFEEISEFLILNVTRWDQIEALHGPESDDWKGKRVCLKVVKVKAFGEKRDAIRVFDPGSKPTQAKKTAETPKKKTNGTGDIATLFWDMVYKKLNMDAADAQEVINSCNGDLQKAYDKLKEQNP